MEVGRRLSLDDPNLRFAVVAFRQLRHISLKWVDQSSTTVQLGMNPRRKRSTPLSGMHLLAPMITTFRD
jgi:hypothetical protein